MNRKSVLMAALGFFVGTAVVGISQNSDFVRKTTSGAVTELFASGNKEAREFTNTGVTFVDEGVMLSDLFPFAEPETDTINEAIGRFEMQTLGDSQSFAVLDTATGVVRGYYPQTNEVILYNATIPNHAATRPLEIHDAFEKVR